MLLIPIPTIHCVLPPVSPAGKLARLESETSQLFSVTRIGSRQFQLIVLILLIANAGGCAMFSDALPFVPSPSTTDDASHSEAFSADRGTLRIHSDHYIPPDDRLFQTLVDLRETLRLRLGVPTSDRPITIYLFDESYEFRRFLENEYPEFPQRRAFFIETEDALSVYAQSGPHTVEDLRHEVVHAYLHAAMPDIPLWLDEGLAEYFEMPDREYGVNRPLADLMASRHTEGRWSPNLRRLESLPPDQLLSERDYAESWLWVYFLMESRLEYRETLRQYINDFQVNPVCPGLAVRLSGVSPSPEAEVCDVLGRLTSAVPR
jgi:hypothetical protein